MSEAVSPLQVEVRAEIDHRVYFAMQQNDVPVVKAVHITNNTPLPLRDLRLCVRPEPAYADPWETRIARLPAGATHTITTVDLVLSPQYLSECTERTRGQLRFGLLQGEEPLCEHVEAVDILARDEWSGLSSLPEILAAFVLPNHPVVARLLREAADILQAWTGDPSLAGYQWQEARRVYRMAGALYSALQRLEITYITPPASFEVEGQRIRLPDRIVESRLGTCLDLTVLTAACLEQMGLHPLIVIVQGHAFAGVWLQDECFAEPTVEEPLRLRKRVDLDEIAVFDPTCITHRPDVDFDTAVREARRRLEVTETFVCAIDVVRARKGQIRPLPERVEQPTPGTEDRPTHVVPTALTLPDVSRLHTPPSTGARSQEAVTDTPSTRLDRWRRRLLDLSLRNPLLNFRETRKTLPLLCADVAHLEDVLSEGGTFQLLPPPRDLAEADPRDPEAYRRRTGAEAIAQLLREQLQARRLHAALPPDDLQRRLIEIYRAAYLGLEEGGASALYLALGFLSWFETPQSTQPRLAPLLLLPLELHRHSVREGFSLRLSDEEPRLNVTLLELLQQDYGLHIPGVEPLPEDDSGVDVAAILRLWREAVRDIDRWEVLERAHLGIFSFAKFQMWLDLTARAEVLLNNPVVAHLVQRPEQAFEPEATFPDAERLDSEQSPLHTFCPLPADASQLAAVLAAAQGRSFVLEGPPGTGKSQTITNLIAHCLAEGKTVLFVSEKMAALHVVYDRLHKVGLGRYCLALHSNKAQKREVLQQLGASLEAAHSQPPVEWTRQAQQLARLRTDLNAYVEALHRRHSTGDSVFQVTARLIAQRDTPCVTCHWPSPEALDADQLGGLRELTDRLAIVGNALGQAVAQHPWSAVRQTTWTPAWEQEVHHALSQLHRGVETLTMSARDIAEPLGFDASAWSLHDLAVLHDIASILVDCPAPPVAILVRPDWDEIQHQLSTWISHGQQRDALRSTVFAHWTEPILRLDLDALQHTLVQAQTAWWPSSWWRRRQVRQALRAVARDGQAPAPAVLGTVLETAQALRREEQALATASDAARALLGQYWQEGEAEWGQLDTVRDWAQRFRTLAIRAAGSDVARAAALRARWARLATEGRALLQRDGTLGRALLAYQAAYTACNAARQAIETLLEVDVVQVWGQAQSPGALEGMRQTLGQWSAHLGQLRHWCAWQRVRREAMQANLQPLVESYEQGAFPSQALRRVFDRSYDQWWHTAVVSHEPVLAQFFSPEHERKIQQFQAVDEQYLALTRQVIAARLAERVPAASALDLSNSEVGILKRELGKRRRHMAIRRLFQSIPNLLPRLKPCLLMSPMSVAQYLDADYPPFDLVVFDEASQIPVWDAVGALARGHQAVIVGDPKQLPPSSFFQRAEASDDEAAADEVVEDLESILDDCLSARLPWLPLHWHYRSRHESLIAFSNAQYYDNRLLTFPSPQRHGMGVMWRHVPDGVYDRGKSSTNRAEADAIVAEIVHRLRDSTLSRDSLGVVTFSQAQQTLIEDLLEEVRRADPQVDAFFAEDVAEPLFVKNLENVQGDERDVILFSICYGPDALGRVSLNFGPMNREGGERRLNVAITRARRAVLVFSTLRAEHIDLARTRARGVRDLKAFLAYAEHGQAALTAMTQYDPQAECESPFEQAVYEALVARGWEVHKQVGCARYRLDLAVLEPASPGRYLLGIECDGANYHRTRVARDRDKLREGILRDLGWRLHRLWSTDWWTHPAEEVQKLEAALQAALQMRQALTSAPADTATAVPELAPESRCSEMPLPLDVPDPVAPESLSLPVYTPYPIQEVLGTREQFYQRTANTKLRKLIALIVQHEGPISLALLTRRLALAWGISRINDKAFERVRSVLTRKLVLVQQSPAGVFLWPSIMQPETYDGLRVPGATPESLRDATDLPSEEVANAALFLLRQHISIPEDTLTREVRRLFGFQRPGRVIDARIQAGIVHLEQRGMVRREQSTVVLRL